MYNGTIDLSQLSDFSTSALEKTVSLLTQLNGQIKVFSDLRSRFGPIWLLFLPKMQQNSLNPTRRQLLAPWPPRPILPLKSQIQRSPSHYRMRTYSMQPQKLPRQRLQQRQLGHTKF